MTGCTGRDASGAGEERGGIGAAGLGKDQVGASYEGWGVSNDKGRCESVVNQVKHGKE